MSSFGFSGTNAHVILEEAPLPPPESSAPSGGQHAIVVSARTASALRMLAGRVAAHLETISDERLLRSACLSFTVRRPRWQHRAAVWADTSVELIQLLRGVEDGIPSTNAMVTSVEGPPEVWIERRPVENLAERRGWLDVARDLWIASGGLAGRLDRLVGDIVTRSSTDPDGELASSSVTICAASSKATIEVAAIELLLPDRALPALARLDAAGMAVDWLAFADVSPVAMPTYPFERKRYWLSTERDPGVGRDPRPGTDAPAYGRRLHCASEDAIFELPISLSSHPALADHRVFGEVVVPGSFYLTVVLACVEALGLGTAFELVDLTFARPLVLGVEPTTLQVVVRGGAGGPEGVRVCSDDRAGAFDVHLDARLRCADANAPRSPSMPEAGMRAGSDAFYERIGTGDLALGPEFRRIETMDVGGAVVVAAMRPTGPTRGPAPFGVGLVDSCFQLPAALVTSDAGVRVPISVERVRWWRPEGASIRARATVRSSSNTTTVADVYLEDDGGPLAVFEGVTLHRAKPDGFFGASSSQIFVERWERAPDVPVVVRPGHLQVLGANDALADALRAEGSEDGGVAVGDIVYLAPDSELDSVETVCAEIARNVAELLEHPRGPRLWIVTRGATEASTTTLRPTQAALWGLARTIAAEAPSIFGGVVDLPCGDHQFGGIYAASLRRHVQSQPGGGQHAWREGAWFRPRLESVATSSRWRPRADGSYVVTGAFGALGRILAAWLVAEGARHLILVGRTTRKSDDELVVALRGQGAAVAVGYADIAVRRELDGVLASARLQMPPIRGAFNAAGQLDDGIIGEMTPTRFARCMSSKWGGVSALDAATADEPLDVFVVFSSASATLGSPGQANYAVANALVDAWARMRRSQGRNVTAIGWGPWTGIGMAETMPRSRAIDLGGMTTDAGLRALARILATPVAHVCVLGGSRTRMPRRLAAHPLFGARLDAPSERQPETSARRDAESIESVLRRLAAKVLGAEDVAVAPSLASLGLDSLMAVELKNEIETSLGIVLPLGVLVQGPSVGELERVVIARGATTTSTEAMAASGPQATWEEGEL